MLAPRTILLHVDSSRRAVDRVTAVRQMADAFDSQVTAMPCAVSAFLRFPYAMEAGALEALALLEEIDRQCHQKAHAAFLEGCAGSPRMHWEEVPGDDTFAFTRRALYADLLVLGQRDEGDPEAGSLPASFLPSVLVTCGRPALILPSTGAPKGIGRTVMIAWKETREAARAVSAAMPWLQRAARVHAVSHGPDAAAGLRRLADSLRAHGVEATLHVGDMFDHVDVGGPMLSTAAALGADLLVMGCYGHSRAREWILGGVTRTILKSMTLPVLMSH